MKTRTSLNALIMFIGLALVFPMQAQVDLPPLSPEGFVKQQVGFTTVEIEYSRPSMRGRVIFGELVPFGEVWRTGANKSTKIRFSEDVTLENHQVPAGSYALYTIPGEDEWTIILSKNLDLWGSYGYVKSDDFLRFAVKPVFSDYHFETMTIDIGELTETSATIQLMWENTIVRFNLGTKTDAVVMEKLDKLLNNPMVHVGNNYYGAASYYLRTHRDMDKALAWVDKAIEINGKSPWYLQLKAEVLAEKGDYRGAIKIADEAVVIANQKNDEASATISKKTIEKWKSMLSSN